MSTGNLNVNSQSIKKAIRFEHELVNEIEEHKNSLIPFSAWVKEACKEKLEREKGGVATSKPKKPPVTPAAQAKDKKLPLNSKFNRDKIQALAVELRNSGKTNKQIAEHFNSLGYLTGYLKSFTAGSVDSLFRYSGNK